MSRMMCPWRDLPWTDNTLGNQEAEIADRKQAGWKVAPFFFFSLQSFLLPDLFWQEHACVSLSGYFLPPKVEATSFKNGCIGICAEWREYLWNMSFKAVPQTNGSSCCCRCCSRHVVCTGFLDAVPLLKAGVGGLIAVWVEKWWNISKIGDSLLADPCQA